MLFLFTSTMRTTVNYLTFSMTIWGLKCNTMNGSHHHTESMTVLKNRFISQGYNAEMLTQMLIGAQQVT